MKRFKVLSILLAFLLILSIASSSSFAKEVSEASVRKIIVFKPNATQRDKDEIKGKFSLSVIHNLSLINGESVHVPEGRLKALERHPLIQYIEDDVIVNISGKPVKPPKPPKDDNPEPVKEEIPWGISAVKGDSVWDLYSYRGEGITVAVLDTGIDYAHPDLNDNINGGINIINPRKSYKDDNGHGTHVAGIIAAEDNEIGVVGVGPEISLYGVKVLDRRGSGYLSNVIQGLEWVVTKRIDIVNMSIGSDYYSEAFEDAVNSAHEAGVIMVAAAGNDGSYVDYPAAYDNVIAVSAITQEDSLASFSSRGPEIDVAAPGVSINSTYKDGSYKELNGTSMATPHVTGVVALMLQAGTASNLEDVRYRFGVDCEDLGDEGKDEYYGYGLVNALNAVQ